MTRVVLHSQEFSIMYCSRGSSCSMDNSRGFSNNSWGSSISKRGVESKTSISSETMAYKTMSYKTMSNKAMSSKDSRMSKNTMSSKKTAVSMVDSRVC